MKVNDVVNWTYSMISLWWISNTDKNTSSLWGIGWRNQTKFAWAMEVLSYFRTETLISLLPWWEMLNRSTLVNIKIKSWTANSFPFICYSIPFTVDWLVSIKAGSLLENYCVIVAGKLVTWSGNFARESRDCVVVPSRGADQVCRLSVDHRIFTRIDVDDPFKCRTEYRILIWTCEEIYFLWSEELKLQRTDCITHNLWQSHHGWCGVRGFSRKRLCLCGQLVTRKGLKQALYLIWRHLNFNIFNIGFRLWIYELILIQRNTFTGDSIQQYKTQQRSITLTCLVYVYS